MRWVRLDVTRPEEVAGAMEVEAVFFLAIASGREGDQEDDAFNQLRFDVNVRGTWNVLEAAPRGRPALHLHLQPDGNLELRPAGVGPRRVRYRLRPSGSLKALTELAFLGGGADAALHAGLAIGGAAALLATCLGLWWRGTRRAAQAVTVIDGWAKELGMIPCPPQAEPVAPPRSLFARLFRWLGRLISGRRPRS